MYYGLKSRSHLMAINYEVAYVFSRGDFENAAKAFRMMMGIASAETRCGTYPDRHHAEGLGWGQLDRIGVKDVLMHLKPRDKALVEDHFGIDLSYLENDYNLIDDDPVLCAIIVRLYLKRIPEKFPDDLSAMGEYYKKYYNRNGAGSARTFVERFIEDM